MPSGFSLIELIMVMTIISILAAIAVPRYANALARYRADAAANRIVADLNYAREYARSSSKSITVEFKDSQSTVTLGGVPGLNNPAEDWVTNIASEPYHARLFSVNFGGKKNVAFNGYGDPNTGGGVKIAVGSEVRTVVLDADTGKAVVQ